MIRAVGYRSARRSPSLQLADLIRGDMSTVQSAIDTLRVEAGSCSKWLGVSGIGSEGGARGIVRLLRLLAQAPTVPGTWLSHDVVTRLRQLSREQAKQQRERRLLEQTLAGWFGGSPPQIDYRAMASALVLSPDEREAIEAVAGVGWQTALGKDPSELLEHASDFAAALDLLAASTEALAAPLAEPQLHTLGQLDQASALTARILALEPAPEHWLTAPAINELERESGDARALLEQLRSDEERLGGDFSDAFVGLVDGEMLIRYRTDHQNFLSRFLGRYRDDQRTVRVQLKNPRKLSIGESLAAVELAIDVKRRRERWNEVEARLREPLGMRFRGRETDWEHVLSDLAVLRGILTDWCSDTAVLRELLAIETAGDRRHALEAASQHWRMP